VRQGGALVSQRTGPLVFLFFLLRRNRRSSIRFTALPCLFGRELFGREARIDLDACIFFGGSTDNGHFAQALVGVDACFRRRQDIGFRRTARFGAGSRHVFEALAVDRRVAQFLFRFQAQVQRRGRGPFRLGLGQSDGFALLFQVRQRTGLFERMGFGSGTGKRGSQGDLVGALALHCQFERFRFGLCQHFGRLARPLGLAFALAREDGHACIGTGAMQDFFAGSMHGGDAFRRLQARLLRLGHQFIGCQCCLCGQLGVRFRQLGGALARFFFQTTPGFGRQAHMCIGFDARTQIGRFLAHGFEALGTGDRCGAQCFQSVAVGFDGVL
jgi:hypothetical protein